MFTSVKQDEKIKQLFKDLLTHENNFFKRMIFLFVSVALRVNNAAWILSYYLFHMAHIANDKTNSVYISTGLNDHGIH